MQLEEPLLEYDPLGHSLHEVDEVEPVAVEYDPAGHREQLGVPVVLE